MAKIDKPGEKPQLQPGRAQAWVVMAAEIALVFVVFSLHGAWPTPHSNENVLSDQSAALLAARLVRGRLLFGIKGRASGFLLDLWLAGGAAGG